MGYKLALRVFQAELSGLHPTTRVVYGIICATALDEDSGDIPAGYYWAGQEYIRLHLFGDCERPVQAQYRTIRRSVCQLVEAGLLSRVVTGGRGRSSIFKITRPVDNTVDNTVDNMLTDAQKRALMIP